MSESQGSSSQASTHGGDRTPYDDDETSREEELQGGSRPAGSKPPPRILLPRIQRYSGRRSEQIFISIRDAIALTNANKEQPNVSTMHFLHRNNCFKIAQEMSLSIGGRDAARVDKEGYIFVPCIIGAICGAGLLGRPTPYMQALEFWHTLKKEQQVHVVDKLRHANATTRCAARSSMIQRLHPLFCEPLRASNREAIRCFGYAEVGKTIFDCSIIKNPTLSPSSKKNYNKCYLGSSESSDDAEETAARANFFRWNWMHYKHTDSPQNLREITQMEWKERKASCELGPVFVEWFPKLVHDMVGKWDVRFRPVSADDTPLSTRVVENYIPGSVDTPKGEFWRNIISELNEIEGNGFEKEQQCKLPFVEHYVYSSEFLTSLCLLVYEATSSSGRSHEDVHRFCEESADYWDQPKAGQELQVAMDKMSWPEGINAGPSAKRLKS